MVNPFLVVTAVVMAIILAVVVIILIIVFGHPDDNESGSRAWIPKTVTGIGLWLAFSSVLILPYDVAARGVVGGSGISVDVLWQICYMTIAIMLCFVIPYSFFYYESNQDPDEAKEKSCWNRQAATALKYTFVFFIAFFIIFICMYAYLREVQIDTHRHAVSAALVVPIPPAGTTPYGGNTRTYPLCVDDPTEIGLPSGFNISSLCASNQFFWKLNVTFPVYVIAFLSFLGWWFFTLFAGVGLIALPLDLINEYRTRPTPMKTSEYFEKKRALGQRATMLIEVGEKIKSDVRKPRSRGDKIKDRKNLREFEKHYYFLKQDYAILKVAHELKGGNPLIPIFKLVLGVLGIGISLSWIIHICVFILPDHPAHQFLNLFFIKLSDVANGKFPLFGVVAYAMWSLYLIWAVVKGNFKLGVRFVFWKIFPMEVNNTLMNAFLANTWVILLCSIPTVQFCVKAFPIYARETSANMLFGTQAEHLEFFRYFWLSNFFIYVIVILSGLTLIWLLVSPQDRSAKIEAILDKMAKEDPRLSTS